MPLLHPSKIFHTLQSSQQLTAASSVKAAVGKRLSTLWSSFQVSPKLLSLELYVEECKHEDNAQVTTPISRGIECRAKEVLPQYAQVRERTSASISEGVGLQLLSRRNSQALSKPLPARLSEGIKILLE